MNLLYSQLILDKFLTLDHNHQIPPHQLTFTFVFGLPLLFQCPPLNHHHFHHRARRFGYLLFLINSHRQNLLVRQKLNRILLVIHLLLLSLRCLIICFFLHYHPLCCHEFIKYWVCQIFKQPLLAEALQIHNHHWYQFLLKDKNLPFDEF